MPAAEPTNVNTRVDFRNGASYHCRVPADASLDAVFDALASEHRREIVLRLSRGAMATPEIGKHFGFTKQALSRHVAVLEGAGLVARTRRGRVCELALVHKRLDRVTSWISHLKRGWQASLDRLDEVLRAD
jgi:DNA-binding transcriptional ArsR family regulator